MKQDKKLIKDIINELYETNYELDCLTLSYNSEFIPEMVHDIDFEYDSITDEKILKSNDIYNFMSDKNSKLMIKLNHLLDLKDRDERVNLIEQKITELQLKKNITVKEFEIKYNISTSSQRDYRSRLNNPLLYHQKIRGGKIVYVVEEVEQWFKNQYK